MRVVFVVDLVILKNRKNDLLFAKQKKAID